MVWVIVIFFEPVLAISSWDSWLEFEYFSMTEYQKRGFSHDIKGHWWRNWTVNCSASQRMARQKSDAHALSIHCRPNCCETEVTVDFQVQINIEKFLAI